MIILYIWMPFQCYSVVISTLSSRRLSPRARRHRPSGSRPHLPTVTGCVYLTKCTSCWPSRPSASCPSVASTWSTGTRTPAVACFLIAHAHSARMKMTANTWRMRHERLLHTFKNTWWAWQAFVTDLPHPARSLSMSSVDNVLPYTAEML